MRKSTPLPTSALHPVHVTLLQPSCTAVAGTIDGVCTGSKKTHTISQATCCRRDGGIACWYWLRWFVQHTQELPDLSRQLCTQTSNGSLCVSAVSDHHFFAFLENFWEGGTARWHTLTIVSFHRVSSGDILALTAFLPHRFLHSTRWILTLFQPQHLQVGVATSTRQTQHGRVLLSAVRRQGASQACAHGETWPHGR